MIDIFKELDRPVTMELLKNVDLKKAHIITLGSESHAKSSTLERIIGFPVFPKNTGLCTRCVTRVHLRRCRPGEEEIYIAKVNRNTDVMVPGSRRTVALYNICNDVQEMMNEIMEAEPSNAVSLNFEILVFIRLPYVPTINLADVPGFVVSDLSSDKVTQKVVEAVEELAQSVITKEKDTSIFLYMLQAPMHPNQSRATALIKSNNIQDRTIGIYTKMDLYVPGYGDDFLDHLTVADTVLKKNGWLFASSPRYACTEGAITRLKGLDVNEFVFFEWCRSKFPGKRYYDEKFAGIVAIRGTLQVMYEKFIAEVWAPKLVECFHDHLVKKLEYNSKLGLPIVSYHRSLEVLQRVIPKLEPVVDKFDKAVFNLCTTSEMTILLSNRLKEVNDDRKWKRYAESPIWELKDNWSTFMKKKQDEWNAANVPIDKSRVDNELCVREVKERVEKMIQTNCDFGMEKLVANLMEAIKAPEPDRGANKMKNWSRLNVLLNRFKAHVETIMKQLTIEYKLHATKQLNGLIEDPLGIIQEGDLRVDGEVVVKTGWGTRLTSIVDYINHSWTTIVSNAVTDLHDGFVVDGSCLTESCSEERNTVLNEMVEISEVMDSLNILCKRVV